MGFEHLFKVEQEGHIAWLILNRPEKRNAIGFDFFRGIMALFQRFDEDPSVRVVIMKGEGKCFTAGTDVMELAELIGDGSAYSRELLREKILLGQECFNAIEKCRKPSIAAVHNYCVGVGVDLLSACDIRIATRDALFGIRETRMGVVADVGTLQRLPHIIGHGWFRELALTGRDFGAEEALKMGFITRICEDREALYEEARRLALEVLACSPLAVYGAKDVILYSRDHGVYPGLRYVAQKNAAAIPSEDMLEAMQAFMEKRPPVFKGK